MNVKSYLLILIMAFGAWQSIHAMDADPIKKKREPSSLRSFVRSCLVGGAAGIIEVSITHPVTHFKTLIQKREPFPWRHPSAWYRGYVVNAGSNVPITVLQMGANALLTSALAKDGKTLSDDKKVFVAALSGAISALACPAEHVMTCQQDKEKSLYPTAQALWAKGWRELYRGFTPTVMRDGVFTAGYLAIAPLATRMIMQHVDNEPFAVLSGGVLTGIGAALVTQPLDMVRARMQLGGKGNVRETINQLYKEGGMISFWRGGCARGVVVVLAITLMSALTDPLSKKFEELGLE